MAKELLKPATVSNAKPGEKDKRFNDGRGLYLLVKPNGAKWWRLDYTIDGKRKTLSFGVYPSVGLRDARRKAEDARANIANGIDPGETRKEIKAAKRIDAENQRRIDAGLPVLNSFEHLARDWLDSVAHTVTGNTQQKKIRSFEKHVSPVIGRLGIGDVKSPHVLAIIKPLIESGKLETAHRVGSEIIMQIPCVVASARAITGRAIPKRSSARVNASQVKLLFLPPLRFSHLKAHCLAHL